MIGVADVDSHGQALPLAHEMILKPSTDNLPLVEKVLRADEAHHAVDQERVERSGHSIRSGLERELVDAVVSTERCTCPVSKHGLVAHPGNVSLW